MNVPAALTPLVTTEQPNEPTTLYEGDVELRQGELRVATAGSFRLVWLPRPRIIGTLKPDAVAAFNLELTEAQAVLSTGRVLHGAIAGLRVGSDRSEITFEANDYKPMPQNVAKVQFHLVNFPFIAGVPVEGNRPDGQRWAWAGRTEATVGTWRMTLDAVANVQALHESLQETGGYAITHTGVVDNSEGSVTTAEMKWLSTALNCAFSFVRGTHSPAVLYTGFDDSGKAVWNPWVSPTTDAHRVHMSAFGRHDAAAFRTFLSAFLGTWTEHPPWRTPLQHAVTWYVQANQFDGIEGTPILAQAGLELLAWEVLVEHRHALTRDGFNRLSAEDRLRLLLTTLRIPLAFPYDELPDLSKLAREFGWDNGPTAVCEFRNGTVHPESKRRAKIVDADVDTILDAWRLSLWMLELCILAVVGYDGQYDNRLRDNDGWPALEPVPWSAG